MNRIYLDMDDVLADFSGKLKMKYRIDKERVSDEIIMVPLKEHIDTFFLDLKPMEGFKHFKSLYEDYNYQYPVKILTSTPPGMDDSNTIVFKQKLEWLQKHIKDFSFVDLLVVPWGSKHEYAYRKNILVDDSLHNIHSWNKEGGLGIHYHPSLIAEDRRDFIAQNVVELIKNICK